MMDLGPFTVTRVSFFCGVENPKTSVSEDPSLRFSLSIAIVLAVDQSQPKPWNVMVLLDEVQ